MDDPLVRLALVAGVALVVLVVRAVRRPGRSERAIANTGLSPGVYLFTSRTCGDCETARRRLAGTDFVEVTWEENPDEFERLGIGEVPGVLVVSANGSGAWHRGVPSGR